MKFNRSLANVLVGGFIFCGGWSQLLPNQPPQWGTIPAANLISVGGPFHTKQQCNMEVLKNQLEDSAFCQAAKENTQLPSGEWIEQNPNANPRECRTYFSECYPESEAPCKLPKN